MGIIGDGIILGSGGGSTASIFAYGVSQSDTVSLVKGSTSYSGSWYQKANPSAHGLPSGYTEIECIKATGTQWINTGFTLSSDSRVMVSLNYDGSSDTMILGANSSTNFMLDTYSAITIASCLDGVATSGGIKATTGQKITIGVSATTKYNYDGTTSTLVRSYSGGDILYVCHYTGSSFGNFIGDIYGVSVYDGDDNLELNLVPCKNSSNVIGLYDTVSNTFLSNSGSGTFGAGDEVPQYFTGYKFSNLDEYGTYTLSASGYLSQSVLVDTATDYDISMIEWLPSGYTELTYIQSSGTQYIDTGIASRKNLCVTLDVEITVTENKLLFGYRVSASDNTNRLHMNVGSGYVTYAYANPAVTTSVTADTNRHTWCLDGINGQFKYDDTVIDTFTPPTFTTTGGNCYLFGVNQNGSLYLPSSMKLYSSTIYNGSTLARDFIPCKNPSDEIGMYDLVSKTFFGNSGTGSFTGE